MNKKGNILFYSFKDDKQAFIKELLKNCNIDKISGQLYCKKCGNLVKIDWFRNLGFCGIHIISDNGVKNRELSCEIYL